jgi:DNA-binding response OmpR family regulator
MVRQSTAVADHPRPGDLREWGIMRILLVEDDVDLAEVVLMGLRDQHLAVDHAPTYAEAVSYSVATEYDIVCLDLGLPDGDGVELCRLLMSGGDVQRPGRVLMLTARDSVSDRVIGLDAGADDYLIKPFTIAELAARIRALSRRSDQRGGPIVVGDVEVDVIRHRATRAGRDLDLTAREFAVLRWFATHPGEVVSTEMLLEHCWDANADAFTQSPRVILSRLRRKLGEPSLIETIRGVGYRFEEAT